jgi:hypothetical protein
MLYLLGAKVMICGLAEVLSPQKAWVRKTQINQFQTCKSKKDWVRTSRIRKVPHLRRAYLCG